jgi:hypothetical protein
MMNHMMHIKVLKTTGEIMDFWAEGIPVEDLPETSDFEIVPLLREDLDDGALIRGQIFNMKTRKIEDTVFSRNLKAEQFLKDTDWVVTRHRDQLMLGIKPSMTSEEFMELLRIRQAKREEIE